MDTVGQDSTVRRLRLRYPATCALCGRALARGTEAYWDSEEKRAACAGCIGVVDGGEPFPPGRPGGSALAEGHRREAKIVREAKQKWGDDAAAVAAKVAAEDPSVKSWLKGGNGESWLGAFLDREVGDAAIPLHDRVIPGTRSKNIDHIVVSSNGVWVIDAKDYRGRVERKDVGPFWREENELYVGGRKRTNLAVGLSVQVTAVRAAMELAQPSDRSTIRPVLCFVETEWPRLLRPFEVRGVLVAHPRALRDRIRKPGDLDAAAVERLARQLASALPAAT